MSRARPARIGLNAQLLSFAGSYRQAGVSRYIAELVRAFATDVTAGPADDVVVFAGPRARSGLAGQQVRWRYSRLPTERPPVRIDWEQTAGPIAAWREHLDLWHGPVNVLPLALPCPGVVTIHDLAFLAYAGAHGAGRRGYLSALTALSARRAARIIAVSSFTRDEIVRRLGVSPAKVTVVPNAADSAFQPLPADEVRRFRAAQRLPDQMILAVGTLEPRKNLTGLLDAFARLAPRTDAELVIAGGKGWLYDPVFARVEALGLAGRVRFTDYIPDADLPLWYNAAEAFVYPSLYEGFGLPPLEALACGTPTVTSDQSSLPEVVGDAALVVDMRDPEALAAALARLLAEPALRAELRQRGPRRAAGFSWARTAAATRAVYDDVLARRARARPAPAR
ncbi:MAG: glycosyltransferase family 4 protein [Thermomicrobiales bacterium]